MKRENGKRENEKRENEERENGKREERKREDSYIIPLTSFSLFSFLIAKISLALQTQFRGVSEWFKEHAWKACVGLKLTEGSNPFPSTV